MPVLTEESRARSAETRANRAHCRTCRHYADNRCTLMRRLLREQCFVWHRENAELASTPEPVT